MVEAEVRPRLGAIYPETKYCRVYWLMRERAFAKLRVVWGGSLLKFIRNGENGKTPEVQNLLRELLAKGYTEIDICAADAVASGEVRR